jgi:maltose phosphorylase
MDLDNYNRNSGEGLHTTSIAAAWMNIVYGFGGLRSDGVSSGEDGEIILNPILPGHWTEYEFGIFYRGAHIRIKVSPGEVSLTTRDRISEAIPLRIYGKLYHFDSEGLKVPMKCTT